MLGAVLGDIIGSVYESHNIKTTDFPLFGRFCRPTDDSVMSIAVADGCLESWFYLGEENEKIKNAVIGKMQYYGRRYPYAGYGGSFRRWLASEDPRPYNSWGNGSAMRVSSVAWIYNNLEDVMHAAKLTAEVTHNHPEGIKGAAALAAAVFLARRKFSKKEIECFVEDTFGYDLSQSLDSIRPVYRFDVSCQGSVPQAIRAFLESDDYESAVRLAVSIGGDSDTIACMTGAIAEAYYGIPRDIREKGLEFLDDFLKSRMDKFNAYINSERRQVICSFSGMLIDMDYMLCIPAVHAIYRAEDLVMDYSGEVRKSSKSFPEEKTELLKIWVKQHEEEIVVNHSLVNHGDNPKKVSSDCDE